MAGAIDDEELLTFREFGSRLQGHPTPEIPWVDVATGSLGQGLPISVGIALAGKRLESADFRVWVLCGDSELAEGSMWEAFEHAGHARPRQPDRDRRRQPARPARPDHARVGHLLAGGARRAPAAGTCRRSTGTTSRRSTPPTRGRSPPIVPAVIFARTKKGSGVAAVEDQPNQHGKPLADPEAAVEELGGIRSLRVEVQSPPEAQPYEIARAPVERPAYEVGEKVATRGAYGDALAWLGSIDEKVVALDGEVGNSTYAERFAAKHPDRFFEMYIAEQQMVAAAVGLQTRGWKPFASSFGAFLSRAYDFVRMAAISDADLKLCGSHVGVSIGPDGPSQMALEDIASLRAVLGSVVLYPSDANQAVQLLDAMRQHRGVSYMRTTREATPVLYEPDETFEIGGSRTVRSSDEDEVTLIGAGITLRECLDRRRRARRQGDRGAGDRPLLGQAGRRRRDPRRGGRDQALITVEDHWAEGGIGETVAGVLAEAAAGTPLVRLAVTERPGSGPPEALLAAAGIDAAHIVSAAEKSRRATSLRSQFATSNASVVGAVAAAVVVAVFGGRRFDRRGRRRFFGRGCRRGGSGRRGVAVA